jgi:Protein of unknown function (DUF3617)
MLLIAGWGECLKEDSMRKAILIVACLVTCASILAAVTEQPLNVKTGLWQVEMNLNYTGLPPQMQAMLDKMTPQQRAAAGLGGTKTYKQCVTPKDLNRPMVQGDDSCRWTILKSSSSDLDVRGTACQAGKNQGLSTEVEVKVHAIDSEHVKAIVHGTGTGDGVNATLDGKYDGKWIGATCPAE